MINMRFLILAYIIGKFVDWVIQDDWQALNKCKWAKGDDKMSSFIALISHSLTYSILTTELTFILSGGYMNWWITSITLFISHAIIDTRLPVNIIMRMKRIPWAMINAGNLDSLSVEIDQRLHEIVILILALFV